MLKDHLEGGINDLKAKDSAIRAETKSVRRTNTGNERNFGALEQQMKFAPKGSNLTWEAMILFRKNKTSEWRNQLDDEFRSKMERFQSRKKTLNR